MATRRPQRGASARARVSGGLGRVPARARTLNTFDEAIERAARLVVIDEVGAVLLFRYDTDNGPCWATPGGRVEAGESFVDAAAREASEELGIVTRPTVPLFEETIDFVGRGPAVRRRQCYFVVRIRRDEIVPLTSVAAAHRREGILEARWWSPADLRDPPERVFPHDLPGWLAVAHRSAREPPAPQ